MNHFASEAVLFIGGCLFYAFKSWLGKNMLSLLAVLGKRLFKVSATEIELYELHKAEALAAKQSNKVHAQK